MLLCNFLKKWRLECVIRFQEANINLSLLKCLDQSLLIHHLSLKQEGTDLCLRLLQPPDHLTDGGLRNMDFFCCPRKIFTICCCKKAFQLV